MSLMIETMESRVLLTATAGVIERDLRAGDAAIITAKADLKSGLTEIALDVKSFKADIKGLKLTTTQKSALATLEKAEASDAAKISATLSKILASGISHGAQLESTLKALELHPTKTANQVKVAAALVKLEAVFSPTVISTVEGDLSADVTTIDADLAAVGTAIPSTQTTVATSTTDLSNDEITLSTDAATIESAITQLSTDLA